MVAAVVLFLTLFLSYFAKVSWFFDLFTHFRFQYLIASLVLLVIFTSLRKGFFIGFSIFLVAANIFLATENIVFVPKKSESQTSRTLTIVQYNRLLLNFDHEIVKNWLVENAERFDVVVLQEANAKLSRTAEQVHHKYPYQVLKARNDAFGIIILSRIKPKEYQEISIPGPLFRNMAIRVVIRPEGFEQDVAIYALHAMPPMDKEQQEQRNFELKTVALEIVKDETERRIMVGDWNLTPYSPFFYKLLKESGLQRQSTHLIPLPTWPSVLLPWAMQIPIDHVLVDPSLTIIKEERENSMGSDHYPLVASFIESP